jgi:3-oxoacyl-[acyl-carrier protein] reductase
MSHKLAGKVAIVTGSSKGIGASIAKHLAAEGAHVVVNYASSKEGAENVVTEIVHAGGKAIAVKANVARKVEIDHLIAETVRAFGPIDVLVNNAGVFEFKPLAEITEEHFRRQYDLNVLGLLLTTQEAVKHFNPKGGSVINISSIVSTDAPVGAAVYAGTKGAVDVITKVLTKELGPKKIRVNTISPSLTETEGTHTGGFMADETQKAIVAATPLGRIGQPEDIAKAVVFLAADDSVYISGQRVVVAGGQG